MSNPLQVNIVPRISLRLLRSPIWSIPIAVILIVGAFLVKVSYDTYHRHMKPNTACSMHMPVMPICRSPRHWAMSIIC